MSAMDGSPKERKKNVKEESQSANNGTGEKRARKEELTELSLHFSSTA